MKRRELLKNLSLTAATIALSGAASAAVENQQYKRKRVLRIAHITDVHIRTEYDAPDRFRKCMEEIKKHKIDFFLNGGDTIYAADYNNVTRERVNEQWTIWQQLRNEFNEYDRLHN